MKKVLLLIFLIPALSFATKKTISTSGFTFSPATTTIKQGDTIVFNVGASHTATEVTQSTWDANEATASGAFNLGVGDNQIVVGLTVGTHYFVCQNHVASMHMKGTIIVELPLSVKNQNADDKLVSIFPNPTKDFLSVKNDGIVFTRISIANIEGKIIKEILPDNNTDKIAISDLANGEYIFSAYTKENDVYVRKFVKE